MRNSSSLILLGVILLAGAAGYVLWQLPGVGGASSVLSSPHRQPDPRSQKPAADLAERTDSKATKSATGHMKAVPKTGDNGGKVVVAENQTVRAERIPSPAPKLDPKPTPSFPTDREIHIGMERAGILTAFGKPTLRTTAVERDRLMEMLVYLNENSNTATFALLRDGRVVSVHTTTY